MKSDGRDREILSLGQAFLDGRIGRRALLRRLGALGVPIAVALALAHEVSTGRPAEASLRRPADFPPRGFAADPPFTLPPTPPFPTNLNPPDPRNPRFTKPTPRPSVTVMFDDSIPVTGPVVKNAVVENYGNSIAAYKAGDKRRPVIIPATNPVRNLQDFALEISNFGKLSISVAISRPDGTQIAGNVGPSDVQVWRPWQAGLGRIIVSASAPLKGFGYAF